MDAQPYPSYKHSAFTGLIGVAQEDITPPVEIYSRNWGAFPHLEKPDLLFVHLVEHLLPSGLVGLVMAALISAVMSHLSGAINSGTTIMTIDIYLPYIRKNATEAKSVRFGRMAGIVIILLGILSTVLLMRYSEKPISLLRK